MKPKYLLIICVALLLVLTLCSGFLINSVKKIFYPRDYLDLVSYYASENDLPEELVFAVIKTESSFNPNAESSAGAMGLMQLMPDTMLWLSEIMGEPSPSGDITDPETNIKYGCYYLKYLYDLFGDYKTAVAAYNAGQGRVAKWLGDPELSSDGKTLNNIPIEETDNYVNLVFSAKEEYFKIYYQ